MQNNGVFKRGEYAPGVAEACILWVFSVHLRNNAKLERGEQARLQLRGQDSQDTTLGATYTAGCRLDERIVVGGNYPPAGSASRDQSATGAPPSTGV